MKKTWLLAICIIFCVTTSKVQAQTLESNCYRGNVEAGYSVGIGDYDSERFEINTTHGYQFNPYFFLGVGTGIHFMSSYKTAGMDVADIGKNLDIVSGKIFTFHCMEEIGRASCRERV